MTSPSHLLDNELVQRYFSGKDDNSDPLGSIDRRAYLVLQAMQEPIRKLERYLKVNDDGGSCYETNTTAQSDGIDGFHPYQLRLPDRFQERREKCKCGSYQTKCPSCGEEHVFVIDYDAKPVIDKPQPALEKCGECGREK